MLKVALDILGEDRIERTLLRTGEKGTDLSEGFGRGLDLIEERVEDQFRSEGAFSGGWEPLADSTQRQKSGPQILIETGALLGSLTGGAGAIREVRPDGADFGSSVEYLSFHHSKAPRSRLPRRPVFEMDERLARSIMREIQRDLFSAAER